MEKNKRTKKTSGGKKKLLRIIIALAFLAAIGTGIQSYRKYMEEQKRRLAMEEQQRQDELEKERLRKLLEEKKREFDALVEEMKRYFAAGNFTKARETAQKALALAKEYNFNTDEIYRILRLMDVADYMGKLGELQRMNEDIYKYLYVRSETLKIPGWQELIAKKTSILRKTFRNEYMVLLMLAKDNASAGKKGEMVNHYYFISRDYFDKAVTLRQKHNIARAPEENAAKELQKEFFFASKKLTQETIPPGLY